MTHTRTLAALSLALLLLLVAAPAAWAQGVPDVGDVTGAGSTTGTVEDAADSVADTANDATSGASETVNDTTENVTGTVDDTTGGVQDTAGDATGTVTDTVNNATGNGGGGDNGGGGGNGGSLVNDVKNTVNGTVDEVKNGLNGSGPGGDSNVDEVLSGSLGGSSGNSIRPGLINDLVDQAGQLGLSPVAAAGWIEGKIVSDKIYENTPFVLAAISGVLGDLAGDLTSATASGSGDVAFSTEAPETSLFESAGRVAVEAAKTLAFPLALALIVVGFLSIQGRIGRKDPKLALAPVDTDEESLVFE